VIGSRNIILLKGIQTLSPIISIWWFLTVIANFGAPMTLNLLREIFIIIGAIKVCVLVGPVVGLVGMVTALYSLLLFVNPYHGRVPIFLNQMFYASSRHRVIFASIIIPRYLIFVEFDFIFIWAYFLFGSYRSV